MNRTTRRLGALAGMEQVDSLIVFKQSPFPVLPPADGEPGGPQAPASPAARAVGETAGEAG